jgi:hypothetical protein
MGNSAAEIIDAKGGPTAFAAQVKRPPGVVRAWKHRNYFPRDAWPEIIRAFPDLMLDKLLKMEADLHWERQRTDRPKSLGRR